MVSDDNLALAEFLQLSIHPAESGVRYIQSHTEYGC